MAVSMVKRKSRWTVQFRHKGESIARTFASKKLAEIWKETMLEAIERAKAENTPVNLKILSQKPTAQGLSQYGEFPTIKEAFERYLNEVTLYKKGHIAEKNRIKIIILELGHYRMNDLTPKILKEYIDRMTKRNFRVKEKNNLWDEDIIGPDASNITKRNYAYLISALYKTATAPIERDGWNIIGLQNPIKQIKLPRIEVCRNYTRNFQKTDLKLFFNILEKKYGKLEYYNNLRLYYRILMTTGMRRSELLYITYENIIWIEEQKKGGLTLTETKNGTHRIVYVANEDMNNLVSIASPMRLQNKKRIFPFTADYVSKIFAKIIKSHDSLSEKRYTLHSLRGHAITNLYKAGLTVKEIARQSGHKTISVLLENYLALSENETINAINKMSDDMGI